MSIPVPRQRTFRVRGTASPMTALACSLCGRQGPFAITRISAPGEPRRFAGPCCASSPPDGGRGQAGEACQERGKRPPNPEHPRGWS